MTTKTREIVKGRITFLSLCRHGKNFMPALYKAENGREALPILIKASDAQKDKGEVLGAVYVPLKKDADDEFARAEVIKELAYSFAQEGFALDVHHSEVALRKDQAYVAESFLIQKGDPRFADAVDTDGNKVDCTGGWGTVIQLVDPDLKRLYKEEGWAGLSMGGTALRKPAEIKKEQTMNEEQIKAMAKAVAEAVVAGISPLLKAAEKPASKAEDENDLTFKGDPTSLKDVRAHRAKLEKAQARKEAAELDWNDPTVVAAFEEGLEKAEEDAKALKASEQPIEDEDEEQHEGLSQVAPKLRKAVSLGLSMAGNVNKRRGYSK